MRRAIVGMASAFGLCTAGIVGHPPGPGVAGLSAGYPAAQCRTIVAVSDGGRQPVGAGALSHYDSRAHASFVTRFDAERRAQLVVRANELEVEKSVAPDGSFTVVMKAGDDQVAASLQKATLDISRNGARLHIELGLASESDLLAVQSLLAGSKAVRLHHLIAANLEDKTLRTPGGTATLLTDVFLGVLGGDVAAIDHFGRELERRRQARSASLVRVNLRVGEGPDSCYVRWENEVMAAWYQMVACKAEYMPFNPLQELCNLRYYMRTECAWFELLSCCAIPIRTE